MKLQYLGTAAAEAVPAPFCLCPVCQDARRKGGRNIRTRSQALVDDRLLLDLPADTYLHTLRDGLKLYDIDTLLVTHCHSDHLYPAELECLYSWAAHRPGPRTFHLYGAAPVLARVRTEPPGFADMDREGRLQLHQIAAFAPFEAEGFQITPLRADHGAEDSLVYLLEKGGRAMLYAHDTGFLPPETLDYLRAHPVALDLVSYDCTNGLLNPGRENHMGLAVNCELRQTLADMGLTRAQTLHVVNHFSHNGKAGYDEMADAAGKQGFLTSYDGMVVEF